MGLINWIKTKISKVPINSSLITFFNNPFTSTDVSRYYDGWVFACVNVISERVANIELKLMRALPDGTNEKVEDHPVLTLLKDVNNFMTKYTLLQRMQSNLELRGNEYWFVQYGTNKIPEALYPLQPDNVTPVGGQYEYIKYYQYSIGGGEYSQIPQSNMIHFKNYNPQSDIIGMGTLQAALTAVQTDKFTKEYNKTFFQNNAAPGVILKHSDTLDPEQQERIIQAWNQNHSGPQRQNKTALLSGGLDLETVQMSQKDMEFLSQRNFSKEEILAYFRVPPTSLGIVSEANYASAKAANYAFNKNTIDPKMKAFINTLNEFLLPLYNEPDLFFDYASPAEEDRDLIIKTYESGLNNGYMTINEVRAREGLPPIENGDVARGPFNLQPIGEPMAVKRLTNSNSQVLAKEITESLKEAALTILQEDAEDVEVEKVEEMSEEQKLFERQGEFKVKQRNQRGLEYESQFKSLLNQLWNDQKQEAKNNLKAYLATKKNKAKVPILIDKEEAITATLDLFTPLFRKITLEEGQSAAEFIGIQDYDPLTTDVEAALLANNNKFAKGVTQVTSDSIRATISAGLAAGEGFEQLEKRIEKATGFNNARAERIARSETIRAQTKAEIMVWEQTGVVEAKVWYTAIDERVCPYCDSMHGKTIALNKDFFKKGETLNTEDGQSIDLDYENVEGPPLHPQCRCVLIPEISSKGYQKRDFNDDEVFELYLKNSNG